MRVLFAYIRNRAKLKPPLTHLRRLRRSRLVCQLEHVPIDRLADELVARTEATNAVEQQMVHLPDQGQRKQQLHDPLVPELV